jgi:hypothetical protein
MSRKTVLVSIAYVALLGSIVGAYYLAIGTGGKAPREPGLLVLGVAMTLLFGATALRTYALAGKKPNVPVVVVLWFGVFVVTAIIYPVFQGARAAAATSQCISNLKQLAMSVHVYAGDNHERLPVAEAWQSVTNPYIVQPFPRCRLAKGQVSYAFNDAASGLSTDKIADYSAVMLFEIESGRTNAHGTLKDVAMRHGGGSRIAEIDGVVKNMYLATYNWDPMVLPNERASTSN